MPPLIILFGMNQFIHDAELGSSEDQRLWLLERAHRWSRVLNVLGKEVPVGKSVYNRYEAGEYSNVIVKQGTFKIPWFFH